MIRQLTENAVNRGWGFFLLALAILSFLYVVFLLCKRCRARREEDEQRAQVDVVLSDMDAKNAVDDSDIESIAEDKKDEEGHDLL